MAEDEGPGPLEVQAVPMMKLYRACCPPFSPHHPSTAAVPLPQVTS